MNNIITYEITHYLTFCYHTSKQIALTTATDCYDKYALHLLSPGERNAELKRLAEMHRKEAEALDRPEYLKEADNPHFLLTYFTSGFRVFSTTEEVKFQQALIISALNRINQHQMAVTDVQIQIQEMEDRFTVARRTGQQSILLEVERMNYLMARLKSLVGQNVFEQQDTSKPKVARGQRKKSSFGYHGLAELLTHIVDDLNVEIGFLRLPTTTEDFVTVVTAKDLSMVKTAVYMGCQNTQLMYIMEYFSTLFSSFTPATIGNSGLFYSKYGTVFNSHNLNSTSLDHVKKRYAIDAIFKKHGIAKA